MVNDNFNRDETESGRLKRMASKARKETYDENCDPEDKVALMQVSAILELAAVMSDGFDRMEKILNPKSNVRAA